MSGMRSWTAFVALAGTLVLATLAGVAYAARPHSTVVGVWETSIWERRSGETLDDIPERLDAERWRINRSSSCTQQRCVLNVVTEALVGPPRPLTFTLRPDGARRYRGTLGFVSMCIEQNTRRVLASRASEVVSTYQVRVVGSGRNRELAMTAIWDGHPTPEGLAAGCNIRSARFTNRARLSRS